MIKSYTHMSRTSTFRVEFTALLTAALLFAPSASYLLAGTLSAATAMLLIAGFLSAYVAISDTFEGRLHELPLASVRLAITFSAFAGALSTAVLFPLNGSDLTVIQGTSSIVLALMLRLPQHRKTG